MRTRADIITDLKLNCRSFQVDEAGFLIDPDTWTRDFSEHVADVESIDLTPAHWEILAFMRASWRVTGVAVDARHVFNFLRDKHDCSKADAKKIFFALFPYGYVKQAVKMAGMKQPRAWSTG